MYDPKNTLIVAFPSHDKKAIMDSVEKAVHVSLVLQRKLIRVAATGTGLANVRQTVLDAVKKEFPDEKERYILWIDSDVLIKEPAETIAEYILEAEKRGVSWSANYKSLTGNYYSNTIFPYSEKNDKLNAFTDDEIRDKKPFELRIGHAGLGLAYVKTPLDYAFHTIGHELDDWPFYTENKIELYYVPVENRHQKWIFLDGA